MADQTDFKHITVNPAEPDDVVIHAGAPVHADASVAPAAQAEAAEPAAKPAAQAAEPAAQAAPRAGAPEGAPGSASKDAYRQTTLEDIQSFKMSKTQIAVIVAALAAIVAFVVWYLVFS